jgi:hypothetical protein
LEIEPIVILKDWPAALGRTEASAYLGVSASHFRELCQTYPDKLRPLNYLPKGDAKWLRSELDSFLEWRKVVGMERGA